MSAIRHEHRTLPVLITLGVLLGAGLALASPAAHRPRLPRPTAVVSVSPTASVTPSPSPSSDENPPEQLGTGGSRCEPVPPLRGWAAGRGGLVHAVHVVAANCGTGKGKGLGNAMSHVGENPGGHHHERQNGTHAGGNDRGGKGGHEGHGGDGKNASDDGSTSGDATGVDTIHGKGKDGEHGKDVGGHGGGHGGGNGGVGGSDSAKDHGGGPPADRGNGGEKP